MSGQDELGAEEVGAEEVGREVDASARALAGTIALVFAGAMHLVVGGFVAVSGRIAPSWVVAMLAAVWLAAAGILWSWHRRRPLGTLLVPFATAAAVWATLTLGRGSPGWGG